MPEFFTAGDAYRLALGFCRVIGVLDGEQGFLEADRLLQDLTRGEHVADANAVAPAHLPAVDADLFREKIKAASMANDVWLTPKPRMAPRQGGLLV